MKIRPFRRFASIWPDKGMEGLEGGHTLMSVVSWSVVVCLMELANDETVGFAQGLDWANGSVHQVRRTVDNKPTHN
jgi:hypothetical protein